MAILLTNSQASTFDISSLDKEVLNLSAFKLSDSDISLISQHLPSNTIIKELTYRYWIESEGFSRQNKIQRENWPIIIDAIVKNNTLNSLHLFGADLQESDLDSLLHYLQNNNNITELGLGRFGSWQPNAPKKISNMIKFNCTLTSIYLFDIGINDDNIELLQDSLIANITLTDLDLSLNSWGLRSGSALYNILSKNTTLKKLNLSRNSSKGIDCKQIVKGLEKNNTLISLNLSQIISKHSKETGNELANVIKSNSSLTELDLSENRINSTGYNSVARGLKKNTSLKMLNLKYNAVKSEEDKENSALLNIFESLKDNTSLTNLDLGAINVYAKGVIQLALSLKNNTSLTTLNQLTLKSCEEKNEIEKILERNIELKKVGQSQTILISQNCDEIKLPDSSREKAILPSVQSNTSVIKALDCSSSDPKIKVSPKRKSDTDPVDPIINKKKKLSKSSDQSSGMSSNSNSSNSINHNQEDLLIQKQNLKALVKEGNATAEHQYNLGKSYEGIALNYESAILQQVYFNKAIKWYEKALIKNNVSALDSLHQLNKKGIYFKLNKILSQLYQKAVEGFGHNFFKYKEKINNDTYPFKLSQLIVYDFSASQSKIPSNIHWIGPQIPTNDQFYESIYVGPLYNKWDDSVMVIDPSGDGNDETAYCVARRYDKSYAIIALGGVAGEYDQKKVGNRPDILENLAKIAQVNKVNSIVIEKNSDNSFSSLFKNSLLNDELQIIKVHNSKPKEVRILDALKDPMDNHKIIIDYNALKADFESANTNNSKYIHYTFFHQLTHFPDSIKSQYHDDRLDAVAMAFKYLQEKFKTLKDPEYDLLED